MRKTTAFFGAATLAALCVAAPAADADVIFVHGSQCAGPGDPAVTSTGELFWTTYGVNNNSTSTSSNPEVTCPVPIRTTGGTTSVGRTVVRVYDRNSSLDITCRLLQLNQDGSVNASFTIGTTSGWSASVYSLDSGLSSPTLTGNYFVVKCNVPYKSTNSPPLSAITSFNIIN